MKLIMNESNNHLLHQCDFLLPTTYAVWKQKSHLRIFGSEINPILTFPCVFAIILQYFFLIYRMQIVGAILMETKVNIFLYCNFAVGLFLANFPAMFPLEEL